jgi:hypothetical protein
VRIFCTCVIIAPTAGDAVGKTQCCKKSHAKKKSNKSLWEMNASFCLTTPGHL